MIFSLMRKCHRSLDSRNYPPEKFPALTDSAGTESSCYADTLTGEPETPVGKGQPFWECCQSWGDTVWVRMYSLTTVADPEGVSEVWRGVFSGFQHGGTHEASASDWLELCSHTMIQLPLRRCSPSTKQSCNGLEGYEYCLAYFSHDKIVTK